MEEEIVWRRQLTQIVDTIAAGVTVMNPDGRIVFANPEAGLILGVSPTAMVGRRLEDPRWNARTRDGLPLSGEETAFTQAIQAGEHVYDLELTVDRADGTEAVIMANATPMLDDEGVLMAIVISFVDITERQRSEEALRRSEEDRFQTVANTVPDVVVCIDGDSTITFANRAAAVRFGYRLDDLIGADVTMLMPERYRQTHRDGLARYMSTGRTGLIGKITKVRGLRRDGTEFPLEISLGTWASGDDRLFVGIIRDLSRRQEEEAA